ncbi:MAG TPA: alpha/beta fold hydrolase [Nevskiaceae bacterium]|nr:alpha/beta fold hydrolase [Nevskiaceae bacterium]
MTTFVLVHGSFHGLWQWGPLLAELDRRGQRAVCVDLPLDDPAADAVDYAQAAMSQIASRLAVDDEIAIVGHSLAGYVIPFLAETLPARHLIFLAAALQVGLFPNLPPHADMALMPADAVEVTNDGLAHLPADVARTRLYQDLGQGLQDWACAQLRKQGLKGLLSGEAGRCRSPRVAASTLCSYVVCADDHAVSPDWGRAVIKAVPRLQGHELPGGHSPFLGCPAQLADLLVRITG